MTTLTTDEQNRAEDIINLGLQQAAEALSFFIKKPVTVEHLHLSELHISCCETGLQIAWIERKQHSAIFGNTSEQ